MDQDEPLRYTDHCWLTVNGEGWAIRRIERTPEVTRFHLWRGFWPGLLQFAHVDFPAGKDWTRYQTMATLMMGAGMVR